MALKGLDIFKLSPKKNCRECGSPTCMAFSMKVAQGSISLDACPYFSADAKASLNEASAPLMKTIKAGTGDHEYEFGGETVLFRHEKGFVNKTRYAVSLNSAMDDSAIRDKLAEIMKVDYERIGEHMFTEMIYVDYSPEAGKERYLDVVKMASETGRVLILGCEDTGVASEAAVLVKDTGAILNGANASNYEKMSSIASGAGIPLGIKGSDIDELYDTIEAAEKLGNKNLFFDAGFRSVKEAFGTAVQFRRAAIRDGNRTCGYPSIIRADLLSRGDAHLQAALLSLFTVKYGSIIVADCMTYAEANPLFGLRQNLFTDPNKPMKVEPGIYPLNGADENSICVTTVDFALTYFLVSGELVRSKVPLNLIISDAGGLSVLTSWAAGKFSADTIAEFFRKQNIEEKIKSRKLIIPGKVAVLKNELEKKLPGWEIIVGPNEAVQLVKFMRDLAA